MSDEPPIGQSGQEVAERDAWRGPSLKKILARHRGWIANEQGVPLPEHDRYLEVIEPAYPGWLDEARCQAEFADLGDADLSELDLSGATLSYANLSGANLTSATLRGANLSCANLGGANLTRSTLRGANVSDADLARAKLRGANVSHAHLSNANLTRAKLRGANLRSANLFHATLTSANLCGANLSYAILSGAFLDDAKLVHANLRGADLRDALLYNVNLSHANLSAADLSGADLGGASLRDANLRDATLTGANLEHVGLVRANLGGATISDCRVYGISAWDVRTNGNTEQLNLIVTPDDQEDQPKISVDDLEVAQFIYLLIDNQKIRRVIETITSKTILILGRFTEERKRVLDALRNELRERGYVPILFDFEKPSGRDLTETITLLARTAHFIIADVTDPRSVPHELYAIVSHLRNVPVQPLLLAGTATYAMFDDLTYDCVLPAYRYTSIDSLIDSLAHGLIEPAEDKVKKLKAKLAARSRK